MIPDAGGLAITLGRRDGRIVADVTPPPSLPLDRFLAGKSAEEAARLVPLIFNICAAAQEAAVRSALNLAISDDLEHKIAAETLREHVAKLCLVWPTALGQAAGREALGLAGKALESEEAAQSLARAIFAPLASAPEEWTALEAWMTAGQTAPAKAFATVAREWDAAWGRVELPLYRPAAAVDWTSATQDGQAVENSAAARVADHRLMTEIAARQGQGLLWRMAARLVELGQLLAEGRQAALAGPGIAQAARGAMLVEASADETGVTAFRRLSPTDFALAPGGLMASGLASLPVEAEAPLGAVAQMLIETVDPCVATSLELADA